MADTSGDEVNLSRLLLGRAAQRVLRYHTCPTIERQTVGAHSFGVCLLLVEITDGEARGALLKAALFHDMAEAIVGDTPSPALRRFEQLGNAYRNAEEEIAKKIAALDVDITEAEAMLWKLADALEGAMFCLEDWARGNLQARFIADRYLSYLDTAPAPTGIPSSWSRNLQEIKAHMDAWYAHIKAGQYHGL